MNKLLPHHAIVFSAIVSFAITLACNPAMAQLPIFKSHQLDRTKSNLQVKVLHQDHDGFLWVGTQQGLYKYDGLTYKLIPLANSEMGNSISALYDWKGFGLVVGGSDGALMRVQRDTLTLWNLQEGHPKVTISDINSDGANQLWIATYGEGLYVMSGSVMYNLNTDDGLNDDYCYNIETDNAGRVWAGSDRGIAVCSFENGKKKIKQLSDKDGLPDNIVRVLAKGLGNVMWAGTQEKGVFYVDEVSLKVYPVPGIETWAYGQVNTIGVTRNEIWIGTEKNGVIDYEYDRYYRFRSLRDAPGAERTKIQDIILDTEGNFWVATRSQLLQSPGEQFEFLSTLQGVSLGNATALLADSRHHLWVGLKADLYRVPVQYAMASQIEKINLKNWNSNIHVISLYEDANGLVWAGTFGRGLIAISPDGTALKHYTETDGLLNDNVLSISGKGNKLLLATLGGVQEITTDERAGITFGKTINRSSGVSSDYIYNVLVDSRGRQWFCTDGGGISYLQGGKSGKFSKGLGTNSDVVYSAIEDNNGNIWFSTLNDGLYCFDNRSLKKLGMEQGLRDLSVMALAKDDLGQLLAVHSKGVDVINPATFTVVSYGEEVNLINREPGLNVITKDSKGDIWFGTLDAIVKYSIIGEDLRKKPVTRLHDMFVFLEPHAMSQSNLDHDQNYVSFNFTGLWFSNPAFVRYQYKLEGFIDEWINTRDNFISFPNLPPGEYHFRIRSAAGIDFNNSSEASYSFSIAKPIWMRSWFMLLGALLIGAGIWLLIRQREKNLRHFERLRQEKMAFHYETLKSQVNPHFLFNSFNTLLGLIEEKSEHAAEYVEKLSDFFRNIVSQRDKDIITLAEELGHVGDFFYLLQQRFGDNIHLEIQVDQNLAKKYHIPPMTLQLLVENAIKHNSVSVDSPLTIWVSLDQSGALTITNNITQPKSKVPSTGFGLQNIADRLLMLSNEKMSVNNDGEKFEVVIPLLSKI